MIKIKEMRKIIVLLTVMTMTTALVGCSGSALKSPCPDFGAHCAKSPINNWDSQIG